MIFIGVGSNLASKYGSPEDTIKKSVMMLEKKGILVRSMSSVWTTEPVPKSDQPWYKNIVIRIETDLTPRKLLKELQQIEHFFGRVRSYKNEARVLDMDILSYGTDVIHEDDLQIPHPRMHRRLFVLKPLQEISPDWTHPFMGRSVGGLISSIDATQQKVFIEEDTRKLQTA